MQRSGTAPATVHIFPESLLKDRLEKSRCKWQRGQEECGDSLFI
jgi:hypothetical protein